jgi:hypothetical protein
MAQDLHISIDTIRMYISTDNWRALHMLCIEEGRRRMNHEAEYEREERERERDEGIDVEYESEEDNE